VFNGEPPVASVMLTNYKWSVGNVELLGPRVSFDLGAQVPIQVTGGYVSADITVTCIVTNGTSPYPGTPQFLQGGASELKLDLTIDLMDGIPGADLMALETTVGDTLGNHDFLLEEPSGFRLLPRTVETVYEPVPRMPGTQHTKIGLVDGNQVEHAFLGWIEEATESRGQNPVNVDVGASYRVKGGLLELVWAYPYSEDLTSLTHDPSVGIIEDNLPPMPPGPLPPKEVVPNVYVFLFALIVGAVILILSVYARAQGY
jgi:hypothetical protein